MRRTTFTVTPNADKLNRCARCGRYLRSGQRATVRVGHDTVTIHHAGRACPPTFNPRPL